MSQLFSFKVRIVMLVCIICLQINSFAQLVNTKNGAEEKAALLLQRMTLEEKIGQMNQYNGFWDVTGPVPKAGDAALKYDHLKKGLVGSVLNVTGVEKVRKLQELVMNESRLGIPLIFGFDVIHGYKTISPIPLAEAASWDMEAIQKSARMSAIEASAVGINWTFGPMVDVSRDPRWGRVMEGSGEDPYLGSKIGVARIKGYQGDDLAAYNTIAATAKHFAGYAFAESGKDYNTVDVGTATLYNIIFPPFKAAVENKVATVMNSFNVLNGIPATANKWLQRDLLKGKWNFKGFVVSDWGSGMEMIDHGYAKDLNDVAILSANAGSDMDMESYAYIKYLKAAVESGKVKIEVIDDAVKRILTLKYELGLFDNPYRYCDSLREKELINHKDHHAIALEMAKKSIVLLKNNTAILPLRKEQNKIVVIGSLANDKNSPLGNWRLGADNNTAVSVLEGFKKYNNQFRYVKGADLITANTSFSNEVQINETDKTGFKEAIKEAKKAEVVIMVLGEDGFQSGEGRSRASLGLPGVQQELLEAVYKVNKNIILVLMNGRPLTITWADEHIPAILETWQLGTKSGDAIAAVIFGEYNPAGKLPMTFPRSVGQIPIYYNHYNTGRPGPKKEVFWSHYGDETDKPLYPFGYGLSYSTFDYSDIKIDDSNKSAIKISVTVTNSGKVMGEEVTQLYIHDKVASIVRPVKELKGFQKFKLNPGESRLIEFILGDTELGFYSATGEFVVEPGEFEVMVGTDSQTGLSGRFDR
jgi:beta-glucosidase